MSKHTWLGAAIAALLPEPDPDIVENIDKPTVRLIIANKNAYVYNAKRYNFTPPLKLKDYMPDIHIKLKYGTDSTKNDLWSAIIYEIDSDFPFNPMRLLTTKGLFCTKCSGFLWKIPFLNLAILKRLCVKSALLIVAQRIFGFKILYRRLSVGGR
jgi:hypothetical protein